MTAYSRIEKNLKDLDSRYQNDDDTDAYFTSKLAILELCGWIEEAMDECITSAYAGRLKHKANRKFIEAKVRRNFGFDYDRNFKPMIVALVGILGFEKISNGINADVFKRLKDDLDELKKARNSLAHTYTTDATERCDAPSVTIGRLANVKLKFLGWVSRKQLNISHNIGLRPYRYWTRLRSASPRRSSR